MIKLDYRLEEKCYLIESDYKPKKRWDYIYWNLAKEKNYLITKDYFLLNL